MKYFFLTGEPSGEQHAAQVIHEIRLLDPKATFVGWGGATMAAAGTRLIYQVKDLSVMGLWEVIPKLSHFRKLVRQGIADIIREAPDVLILVDFSAFNLRIAKRLAEQGIPTAYYILPKVWAWNTGRIELLKRYVDRSLAIFPFEVDFHAKYQHGVTYVGNPTEEAIRNHQPDQNFINKYREESCIAFLPGSRPQEITKGISILKQLASTFGDYLFLVPTLENVPERIYEPVMDGLNVELIPGKTFEILEVSKVAIVTSGTATLEAAIIGTPQIVVYRTSWLTYLAAKMVLRKPYISLVNTLLDRLLVKELVQSEFSSENLAAELERLLADSESQANILHGYAEIRQELKSYRTASNVAQSIIQLAAKRD